MEIDLSLEEIASLWAAGVAVRGQGVAAKDEHLTTALDKLSDAAYQIHQIHGEK